MERLNGMDASFIYAETPAWHMHVGALFVLDPSSAPEPFDADRLRRVLACRLDELEPFTARLFSVPFGLARPNLVHDRPVDVDRHVYRVGVPPPGGPEQLAELVGELFERKLEPGRPLWEAWFIEGLDNGNVAVLLKAHHALVDGARGLQLYEVLFDVSPDAPIERDPHRRATEQGQSPLGLFFGAVPWLFGTPVRAVRLVRHLGQSAVNLARLERSDLLAGATWPFQAPKTSMNNRITAHRAFSFCSIDLGEVKEVKQALGGTVNDVVLAVCAGALRTYLDDRGELPAKPLVAQIPVAVNAPPDARADGTPSGGPRVWGNQVSVIGASLATDIADPVERLRAITRSTTSAKEMGRALGDTLIAELAGLLPPLVVGTGVKLYQRLGLADRHPPIFNLIVSNVKGPDFPLFVAGARLEGNYPIGPLLDGSGLNITVTSYRDRLDFGFAVCPELVDDAWALARSFPEAFDELHKAATEFMSPSQPVR